MFVFDPTEAEMIAKMTEIEQEMFGAFESQSEENEENDQSKNSDYRLNRRWNYDLA